MDSRRLPGVGPPLKRGFEGSGEKSPTTSTQITDDIVRNKRICLEAAAGSVEKELSHNGSTTSSESQPEDLRKFNSAVEEGNLAVVEHLLTCGNDVDALRLLSNHDARAPLCTAVKNKHYPVAELLIRFKADVNALDEDRKPPLYYAIRNVDVQTTKLLLNNGAKVENFPELLHLAASKKSIEIVEALLQQGVDVNVRGEFGDTVLYSVVYTACEAILKSKRGTETDTTNTASIYNEFVDMFDLLLKFNANVNSANDRGSTSLHSSARNGNLEISALLLSKGANINTEDERRIAPLHLAVMNGHEAVVKLLLDRGAEVNLENDSGYSPLHFAMQKNNRAIIDALLTSGACINAKTQEVRTPLYYAVGYGHEEAVKLLLERGAQVNCRGHGNNTPLHLASSKDYSRIIEILLRFGASVNSRDDEGLAPLHYASVTDKAGAVATLLDNGADVSIKCKESYTPFAYAWRSDDEYNRIIAMEMPRTQLDTIDAFFRHQIKLEVAGLNPTVSNSPVCQREGNLEDYYFECQLEIAKMKSSFIGNTNVSYFDILNKGSKCVAKYCKTQSIVLALESQDLKREFPIYAGVIGFKFQKCLSRTKLVERANLFFHCISHWPKDCTEAVLDFLDDESLRVFSEI